MKAIKKGATINPFSEKNLQWDSYSIPKKDLLKYDNVKEGIHITKFKTIYSEFEQKFKLDFDRKRKLARLDIRDYIHSLGLWEEYIKFLVEYKTREEIV